MPRPAAAKQPQKQEPVIGVRMPPDLSQFVREAAERNFRSVSSEIAHRVELTRQQELRQGASQ